MEKEFTFLSAFEEVIKNAKASRQFYWIGALVFIP
jgi:hypothetical protein